ncbi:MAG: nucleotidyl transferase AbiEii/AbiGii toxin family protein [Deltaproteobacteria bacterium]|nr:nucleotidyl transferase AbiEii/AbiGii toxin family protein [Deltaproteobacteria bacterium]
MTKKYKTSTAFRQALDDHLRMESKKRNIEITRLKKQVAFDRFLCRVFQNRRSPWYLKGGYALELRFADATITRDIDLALEEEKLISEIQSNNYALLHELLQDIATIDIDDFFTFIVGSCKGQLEGAPEKGARFPIESQMDGRTFSKFSLDISLGDVIIQPIDKITPMNFLAFAGISVIDFPMISVEQQFAEKLHAYTRPRKTLNSRVKDLLDMTILVDKAHLNSKRTAAALHKTFEIYKSHAIPKTFPAPPPTWERPFFNLAGEDMQLAYQRIASFYDMLPL